MQWLTDNGRGIESVGALALSGLQHSALRTFGQSQGYIGTQTQYTTYRRAHASRTKLGVVPFLIDHKAATGTQTLYLSLTPVIGQSGQEVNGTVMALKKHLTDTGRNTEITVNLEWRMGIEEVWISAAIRMLTCRTVVWQQVQHILDNRKGMVTIEHAGPEIGLPAKTPARSHVATLVQRISCCGEEVKMAVG